MRRNTENRENADRLERRATQKLRFAPDTVFRTSKKKVLSSESIKTGNTGEAVEECKSKNAIYLIKFQSLQTLKMWNLSRILFLLDLAGPDTLPPLYESVGNYLTQVYIMILFSPTPFSTYESPGISILFHIYSLWTIRLRTRNVFPSQIAPSMMDAATSMEEEEAPKRGNAFSRLFKAVRGSFRRNH